MKVLSLNGVSRRRLPLRGVIREGDFLPPPLFRGGAKKDTFGAKKA